SVTTLFIFIQAVNHNLPRWSWFLFVILMESVFVGLGQMVRRRWTHVLGDNRNLINAAFSFEALADEVIFTFGPIIATLVATTISPTAAVYTCMGFLLVGGTIFLTSIRLNHRYTSPRKEFSKIDSLNPHSSCCCHFFSFCRRFLLFS
ncbi:MAG: hypothetical protein EBQ63_04535, partial [Actinobacteria bacterium]|nr:hypothetical protein [Actinomycetota bacterium]